MIMSNNCVVLKKEIQKIYDLVGAIKPLDMIEKQQIEDTLTWVGSGASIFRITKSDLPNKHLVAYCVLLDRVAKKILLVDHKQAQLWLPAGGHVEINEDPMDTVKRECYEELNINAEFFIDAPIFLTVTTTVGLTPKHVDVSLWYLLKGSCQLDYKFDPGEFNTIKWFGLDEIPYTKSDPAMKRFIHKIQGIL